MNVREKEEKSKGMMEEWQREEGRKMRGRRKEGEEKRRNSAGGRGEQ